MSFSLKTCKNVSVSLLRSFLFIYFFPHWRFDSARKTRLSVSWELWPIHRIHRTWPSLNIMFSGRCQIASMGKNRKTKMTPKRKLIHFLPVFYKNDINHLPRRQETVGGKNGHSLQHSCFFNTIKKYFQKSDRTYVTPDILTTFLGREVPFCC